MTKFIQLHLLTSYPPSNLNRDDLGRPKTAVMGGVQRLRISSQSLKRAWRTSDLFLDSLVGHAGIRTRRIGQAIKKSLMSGVDLSEILRNPEKEYGSGSGIPEKDATQWAWQMAAVFSDKSAKAEDEEIIEEEAEEKSNKKGKKDKKSKSNVDKDTLAGEVLVFYSPEEIKACESLVLTLIKEKRPSKDTEIKSLPNKTVSGADLGLFGRMLASNPKFNVEAACQVAHAITVHKVAVEDDYFTAVDDLNKQEEDAGAGHIGETEFAAGLFYLYVCVDSDLLVKNLSGNKELAQKTIRALVECMATIAPTGKQNSFASRAYASYVLAEKGNKQPRSLSVAFLTPIDDKKDLLDTAIGQLEATRDKMDAVYGKVAEESQELNAKSGKGTLADLIKFVASF